MPFSEQTITAILKEIPGLTIIGVIFRSMFTQTVKTFEKAMKTIQDMTAKELEECNKRHDQMDTKYNLLVKAILEKEGVL